MNIVYFGTYDLDKPRNRLMIAALKRLGHAVTELHAPVWDGVADKSQVRGARAKARFGWRWLSAYPGLIRRWRAHCRAHGAPDMVFVGYLGHLDVLVLRRFARQTPIVWDAFLSIYDTVVRDRKMVGPRHPAARLLFAWERAACRTASRVVLDTPAHGAMFADLYGFDPAKLASVPVGAEMSAFPRQAPRPQPPPARPRVLFYGQFIPLHGIATIIAAARAAPDLDWQIIGTGQEAPAIRADLAADPVAHLTWTDWVDYDTLIDHIAAADVCLGIFGASEKAARVIPNKAYQILAAGRPLVTRDGPAARDFFGGAMPGVRLVPPADPAALVAAIRDLAAGGETPPATLTDRFSPDALTEAVAEIIATTPGAPAPPPPANASIADGRAEAPQQSPPDAAVPGTWKDTRQGYKT